MRSIIANKKGLSELISYVLLVVMVVAIASGVYIWAKSKVPVQYEECPSELTAAISSCWYTATDINLRITNTGKFDIDCFYFYLVSGGNATKVNYETRSCDSNSQIIPLNISSFADITFIPTSVSLVDKIKIIPVKIQKEPLLCQPIEIAKNLCTDYTAGGEPQHS